MANPKFKIGTLFKKNDRINIELLLILSRSHDKKNGYMYCCIETGDKRIGYTYIPQHHLEHYYEKVVNGV